MNEWGLLIADYEKYNDLAQWAPRTLRKKLLEAQIISKLQHTETMAMSHDTPLPISQWACSDTC